MWGTSTLEEEEESERFVRSSGMAIKPFQYRGENRNILCIKPIFRQLRNTTNSFAFKDREAKQKSNATKWVERTRNSRPRKEWDGVISGIIYMRILLGISFLFCSLALAHCCECVWVRRSKNKNVKIGEAKKTATSLGGWFPGPDQREALKAETFLIKFSWRLSTNPFTQQASSKDPLRLSSLLFAVPIGECDSVKGFLSSLDFIPSLELKNEPKQKQELNIQLHIRNNFSLR